MGKEDEKKVNTGGGPYIKGGVKIEHGDFVGGHKIVGDGNVIGSGRAAVIKQVSEGATLEGFVQLLAALRQALPAAGLDHEAAEVIEADVRVVEAQATKEKPNGVVIASKLKGIAELLTAGGAVATATQKLLPLTQQAIQWAQQLFR